MLINRIRVWYQPFMPNDVWPLNIVKWKHCITMELAMIRWVPRHSVHPLMKPIVLEILGEWEWIVTLRPKRNEFFSIIKMPNDASSIIATNSEPVKEFLTGCINVWERPISTLPWQLVETDTTISTNGSGHPNFGSWYNRCSMVCAISIISLSYLVVGSWHSCGTSCLFTRRNFCSILCSWSYSISDLEISMCRTEQWSRTNPLVVIGTEMEEVMLRMRSSIGCTVSMEIGTIEGFLLAFSNVGDNSVMNL